MPPPPPPVSVEPTRVSSRSPTTSSSPATRRPSTRCSSRPASRASSGIHFTDGGLREEGRAAVHDRAGRVQGEGPAGRRPARGRSGPAASRRQEYDRQIGAPETERHRHLRGRAAGRPSATRPKPTSSTPGPDSSSRASTSATPGSPRPSTAAWTATWSPPATSSAPVGPPTLATITRIDPIYAYFALNERDLLRLVGCRGRGGQTTRTRPSGVRRPRGRGRLPQRRAARFRLHAARPRHGHHPDARRLRQPPSASGVPPCFRACSCACASPSTSATRRCWSPSARSASTRPAATCSSVDDQNVVEQRPVKAGALGRTGCG